MTLDRFLVSLEGIAAPTIAVLGTYLLHSTVLLLGAWLFSRSALRRSFRFEEWLWKGAATIPLVTVPLVLSNNLVPLFGDFALRRTSRDTVQLPPHDLTTLTVAEAGGHDEQPKSVGRWRVSISTSEVPPRSTAPVPAGGVQSIRPEGAAFDDSISQALSPPIAQQTDLHFAILAGLYFGGAMFGCVRIAWRQWRLRQLVCRSEVLVGQRRRVLDRLLKQAGLARRVELMQSPDFAEPVAFGVRRWRIVVPIGCEGRLNHDEWTALLAHEVAHLVRGDVTWLWIGQLVGAGLFIQPLNLLARGKWQRAAEFLCDEWAVAQNVNALALASCLTRVAEWRLNRRLAVPALASTGSRSSLNDRVVRLLADKSPADVWIGSRRHWMLRGGALLLIGAFAGFGPRIRAEVDRPNSFPAKQVETHHAPAAVTPTVADANDMAAELLALQQDLDRCDRLAAELNDEQLRLVVRLLRHRAELLGTLVQTAAKPSEESATPR